MKNALVRMCAGRPIVRQVQMHEPPTCGHVDHGTACLHNSMTRLVAHSKVRQDWRNVKHDRTQVTDRRRHGNCEALCPIAFSSSQLVLTTYCRPQLFHVRPQSVVVAHRREEQLLQIWGQCCRGRRGRNAHTSRSSIDDRRALRRRSTPTRHRGDAVEGVSLDVIPTSRREMPVTHVT